MHPAVAALALEEKGFVLATLLSGGSADEAVARLDGAARRRCASALAELLAATKPERASALAALLALVAVPVPAGIERCHPGWLRERFERESSAVVHLVAAGLPPEVAKLAAEVVDARREPAPATAPHVDAAAAAQLKRTVFAGLVPLSGPGAPVSTRARDLLALEPAALIAAVERAGAELLGTSLRGASGATVARAAAALAEPLARVMVAAAARTGSPEARDHARGLVAAAGQPAAGDVAWALGARAIADELHDEPSSMQALAQRLPPERGRRLLQAAGW
jgi:hypothetical protein